MLNVSRVWSSVLAGLGALAVAGAVLATGAFAADATQTFSVGVAACAAPPSQLCSPVSTVSVNTSSVLRVEFVAATTHCSSVIAHLLVDGVEKFKSGPLGPGQGTGAQDLGPVAAGEHQLGVQGEGVLGGCDTGVISSWAGTLNVIVADSAGAGTDQNQFPGSYLYLLLIAAGIIGAGAVAFQLVKRRAPLTSVIAPPQGSAPLTSVIAPPQGSAPLTSVIAPPQGSAPLTSVIAPPQGSAPLTSVIAPPQGSAPLTSVIAPPQGSAPLNPELPPEPGQG